MEVPDNSSASLELPDWLNEELFREIQSQQEGDEDSKVIKLDIESANKKGENYSSVMLRAHVQFEDRNQSITKRRFIVKMDPVGITQDIMDKFNVFPKEIEVYNSILPRFEALFRNSGEEEVQFSPRCLRTSCGKEQPGNMLILEDLCVKGYRTANRLVGLDVAHAELALKALAQFHAASAVYYQEVNKEVSNHFNYGLYAEHMKPILYEMYRKNIDLMREISATWDCRLPMHRFLDNYKSKMLDRVFELMDTYRGEGRFVVLCHGDFWCNNVMYRYDDSNNPEECLLLDFQLSNYNSPAFDLNYFIFTSIRKDLKLTHIDHFIHFYHQELVANIQKLQYSERIPTLAELHRDFQDLGAFALNSTYGTLCAVVAPPGKDSDMNSLLGDDEDSKNFRKSLFSNPLYVEALEQLIPYFERKGIF